MSAFFKLCVLPLTIISFVVPSISFAEISILPASEVGCTLYTNFSPITGAKCSKKVDKTVSTITDSPSCLFLDNVLRYGTSDSQVKGEVSKLQAFLKHNDYLTANVTGVFGIALVIL